MHMADALVSPAVGGSMWVVSGGLLAWCARKVRLDTRDNLVPLMGVLGAFVFTAQMINFAIPGTGSSGHLGGGLILAALLGPHAAFLTLASILTVQAFFFGDGGLLALGCNMFNMGFYATFIAYPFIYRAIVKDGYLSGRAIGAAVLASSAGLLLGAFSVVLETRASGISALPFGAFTLLMLPVHLAIGIVEGVITAAVVAFVARARPEAVFGGGGVSGGGGGRGGELAAGAGGVGRGGGGGRRGGELVRLDASRRAGMVGLPRHRADGTRRAGGRGAPAARGDSGVRGGVAGLRVQGVGEGGGVRWGGGGGMAGGQRGHVGFRNCGWFHHVASGKLDRIRVEEVWTGVKPRRLTTKARRTRRDTKLRMPDKSGPFPFRVVRVFRGSKQACLSVVS
jgi:cobalamin biosynthesis protein CbiM